MPNIIASQRRPKRAQEPCQLKIPANVLRVAVLGCQKLTMKRIICTMMIRKMVGRAIPTIIFQSRGRRAKPLPRAYEKVTLSRIKSKMPNTLRKLRCWKPVPIK